VKRLVPLVLAVLALAGAQTARAAGQPGVGAAWVSEVTATSANLRAEINPNGLATVYRFEYVTLAAFEVSGFDGAILAPPSGQTGIGSGTAPVAVVQHIASLVPATAYRYRLAATNSAAAVLGPEHTLTTQEASPSLGLPDARRWELVSQADKGGGAIEAPGQIFGGGIDQAAAQGGAFTYSASSSFGDASGAPPGSQYLAGREPGGWVNRNISTPLRAGAYGDQPNGVPYRAFGPDLGEGLLFGGGCYGAAPECAQSNPPLPGSGAPGGYPNFYRRDSRTGAFEALLDQADFAHSPLGPEAIEIELVAVTPDLSQALLSSCAALTADAVEVPAPGGCDGEAANLYEGSGDGLSLVNLLPGDVTGIPGARVAAPLGAISADGSRVYWAQGGELYLRESGDSVRLDGPGGKEFQAASGDGSVAYFTAATAGHTHLFRYLAETGVATDLTPAGEVEGVLGASADGSIVYYQDDNGLKRWQNGGTTEVAAGAGASLASNHPPATGTARLSPDGAHLAFLSAADLGDYENAGRVEAYLYGPPAGGGAPVLVCASCNPTGERPQGSASIPAAPPNGDLPVPFKPRALSAAGTRLFFDSADALVVGDTNNRPDVYQWEAVGVGSCTRSPGCVALISSGRSPEGASFLDASADGSDAFFLTDDSLVGADGGSLDVYDARVGGGFVEPPAPIPCVADACQSLPAAPDDPTPGTLVPNSGNPPLRIVREGGKRKKHHTKKKGKRRKSGKVGKRGSRR
jgi:hypothetical protein